ncbi:MAG: hypothetical protein L3K15_04645 [Thermoplasmata archaeon]|nr:hypothetical protein [Thermoplasmata archaeon]
MRLHKVINRVVRGTVYYRWVLTIPPREVRSLGWVAGQQLESFARGSILTLQPTRYPVARRPRGSRDTLREEVVARTRHRFDEIDPKS